MSIDYLACTFPLSTDVSQLRAMFQPTGFDWTEMPHGLQGYLRAERAGHLLLLSDPQIAEMGIHVQAKGEGCDELETQPTFRSWQNLLEAIAHAGGSLSRLDVAFDDRAGVLSLPQIEDALVGRHYTSKWRRTCRYHSRKTMRDSDGITLSWGDGQSKISLRIYDYAKKHGLPAGTHWIRVELQCRDQAADATSAHIREHGLPAAAAIIGRYLQLREPTPHTRAHRAPVAAYWAAFLATAERARLVLAKPVRTILTVLTWLERQAAPALALAQLSLADAFDPWLRSTIGTARRRLRPEALALIPR